MSDIKRTSDMVLLHQDDEYDVVRVLLVKRKWPPYEDHWALPGGFVDDGEEHIDAAVRELGEETGVPATKSDLVRVGRYDTAGRDPRGEVVTEAFAARVSEMTDPKAMDDARDAAWWMASTALVETLAFDHNRILLDALKVAGF